MMPFLGKAYDQLSSTYKPRDTFVRSRRPVPHTARFVGTSAKSKQGLMTPTMLIGCWKAYYNSARYRMRWRGANNHPSALPRRIVVGIIRHRELMAKGKTVKADHLLQTYTREKRGRRKKERVGFRGRFENIPHSSVPSHGIPQALRQPQPTVAPHLKRNQRPSISHPLPHQNHPQPPYHTGSSLPPPVPPPSAHQNRATRYPPSLSFASPSVPAQTSLLFPLPLPLSVLWRRPPAATLGTVDAPPKLLASPSIQVRGYRSSHHHQQPAHSSAGAQSPAPPPPHQH